MISLIQRELGIALLLCSTYLIAAGVILLAIQQVIA